MPAPGLSLCKASTGGGRSYLLPAQPTPEQLQQVMAGDAGVRPTLEVLAGATDHWLHVLHRVKAGRDAGPGVEEPQLLLVRDRDFLDVAGAVFAHAHRGTAELLLHLLRGRLEGLRIGQIDCPGKDAIVRNI